MEATRQRQAVQSVQGEEDTVPAAYLAQYDQMQQAFENLAAWAADLH
ncbi:MAG: hypothetical protein GY696_14530 [Gammaproteobacteria bacterium]|nr:hypothetical protein [Gammaproteobacteria bacterium]